MSGTHHLYTITGRALPRPPRHAPSRYSDILRLPTHRYDPNAATQTKACAVMNNSNGHTAAQPTTARGATAPSHRTEMPYGGEFSTLPASARAQCQVVPYSAAIVPANDSNNSNNRDGVSMNASQQQPRRRRRVRKAGASAGGDNDNTTSAAGVSHATTTTRSRHKRGEPPQQHTRRQRSRQPRMAPAEQVLIAADDSVTHNNDNSSSDKDSDDSSTYNSSNYRPHTPRHRHHRHDDDMSSDTSPSVLRVSVEAYGQLRGDVCDDLDEPHIQHDIVLTPTQQERLQQQQRVHGQDMHVPRSTPLTSAHTEGGGGVSRARGPGGASRGKPSSHGNSDAHTHGHTPHTSQQQQQQSQSQRHAPQQAPLYEVLLTHAPSLRASSIYEDSSALYAAMRTTASGVATTSHSGIGVPFAWQQQQQQREQDNNNNNKSTNAATTNTISSSSELRYRRRSTPHVSTYRPLVDEPHAVADAPPPPRSPCRPSASRPRATSPGGDKDIGRGGYDEWLQSLRERLRRLARTPHDHGSGVGGAAVGGCELLASRPRLQGMGACDASDAEDNNRALYTIVRFLQRQPPLLQVELQRLLQECEGRETVLCEALSDVYGEEFDAHRVAAVRGNSDSDSSRSSSSSPSSTS